MKMPSQPKKLSPRYCVFDIEVKNKATNVAIYRPQMFWLSCALTYAA